MKLRRKSKELIPLTYLDGVWGGNGYRNLNWNRDWDWFFDWDRDRLGLHYWVWLGYWNRHWDWMWDRNWYLRKT